MSGEADPTRHKPTSREFENLIPEGKPERKIGDPAPEGGERNHRRKVQAETQVKA